jgi:hypothetical protein
MYDPDIDDFDDFLEVPSDNFEKYSAVAMILWKEN